MLNLKTRRSVRKVKDDINSPLTVMMKNNITFKDENVSEQNGLKVFWNSISKKILTTYSPQHTLNNFETFIKNTAKRGRSSQNLEHTQHYKDSRPQIVQPRRPIVQKSRITDYIDTIRPKFLETSSKVLSPADFSASSARKNGVRFDFSSPNTSNPKKVFFNSSYMDGSFTCDDYSLEGQFSKGTRNILSNDLHLNDSKSIQVHRTNSLQDLPISRLLDESHNNTIMDKIVYDTVHTLTSIEEKVDYDRKDRLDVKLRSRSQSIILDIDLLTGSKLSKSRASRVIGKKETIIITGASVNRTSSANIGEGEQPVRRKSCSCRDCGINSKLVWASALIIDKDLDLMKFTGQSPQISPPGELQKSNSRQSQRMLLGYNPELKSLGSKSKRGSISSNAFKASRKISSSSQNGGSLDQRQSSFCGQSGIDTPKLKNLKSLMSPISKTSRQFSIRSNNSSVPNQNNSFTEESPENNNERPDKHFNFCLEDASVANYAADASAENDMNEAKFDVATMDDEERNSQTEAQILVTNNRKNLIQFNDVIRIEEKDSEGTETPMHNSHIKTVNDSPHIPLSRFSNNRHKHPITEIHSLHKGHNHKSETLEYSNNSQKILLFSKIIADEKESLAHPGIHKEKHEVKKFDTARLTHDASLGSLMPLNTRSDKSIDQNIKDVIIRTGKHIGLLSKIEDSVKKLKSPRNSHKRLLSPRGTVLPSLKYHIDETYLKKEPLIVPPNRNSNPIRQRKSDEKESFSFNIRTITTPNRGSMTTRNTKLSRAHAVTINNDNHTENSIETKNSSISGFLSHRQRIESPEKELVEHKKHKTKAGSKKGLSKKDVFITTYNNINKPKNKS